MRVGILGGGTMGLVLALRLARAGLKPIVLEAAPQIGGLSTWHDYGDFTWDRFYHVIPRQDDALLGIIEEMDLGDKLHWRTTRTGFLWNSRLISMSNYREFLTFPALNPWQKTRLAAGLLVCRRWNDPASLEGMTAEEWLVQVFGRGVYETIWEPLLESKYGALKDQTPAMIMWATIRRYDSTRSRGSGAESLGFLSGGLRTLLQAMERRIVSSGGEIRASCPVSSIRLGEGEVDVESSQGAMAFDRLINTLPSAMFRKLAAPDGEFAKPSVAQPSFLGVVCLSLVLRRPLSPYYVVNLIQKGFSFTGIIGVSTLTGPEELNGNHLVMLPRYDIPDSLWFDRDPEEVADEFVQQLSKVWPDIGRNLLRWHLNRERRVQALWTQTPPSGEPPRSHCGRLWSINAELAGRDTLNNNAVIGVAESGANAFLAEQPQVDQAVASAQTGHVV